MGELEWDPICHMEVDPKTAKFTSEHEDRTFHFCSAGCNLVAIPIAAGALHPSLGLLLRPEFGALAMSVSSITVVTNALLLRRAERSLPERRWDRAPTEDRLSVVCRRGGLLAGAAAVR